jgi:tetratricopeptide (TPR) repeat protein
VQEECDGSRRRGWLVWLGIVLATAAVFARGLSGELVYDDRLLIARNPSIASLSNLWSLFTNGYWDFLDIREADHIPYWRPLTAIVQALIWPFAGTDPFPYHLASLLIHLGAVTAAYLLALRLGASSWVAGAAGLLFGLHPAHVESVSWISALNDPLFGCLALFSLERFLAWRAAGSQGRRAALTAYLPALLCFALALLAKELAAALVPLLFLLDLLRPAGAGEGERTLAELAGTPRWLSRVASLARVPVRPLAAYLPFAVVFALYMLARMLVFESPLAGFERITTDFGVDGLRLAQLRLELFGGALELLVIPLRLVLFRPFRPAIEPLDPALVRALVWSCLFVGLLVALLLGRRKLALSALLVIPTGLMPALVRVESLGAFPLSDRFLYLPAFGLALGAALLLCAWLPGRGAHIGLALLAGAYALRSWTRIADWRDEVTVFSTAARQEPRSVYVLWGLGRAELERFNATREVDALAKAWLVFEEAERLLIEAKTPAGADLMVTQRDFVQVTLGFAWCSIHREEYAGASMALEDLVRRIEEIQAQERAAREAGLAVRADFLDLEKAYTALGTSQFLAKQYEAAERSFARSLELQPSAPETHQNLGRMYVTQGRFAEAAQAFERALALRPGNAEDRLLLAQALESAGEHERAETLARTLIEELPERDEPLLVLATAALNRRDSATALEALDRVLTLEPRHGLAWYQKARAYLLRGDARSALVAFRNAVEIDPSHFESHYDLASILLADGALAEARPYLVRAYTLAPAPHRAALHRNLVQFELEAGELLELAQCDLGRNEHASALEFAERLLVLEPRHVEGLVARARLRRRAGEHEGALADYRAASERATGSFSLWSELGSYLHELKRPSEAEPILRRALEIGPPAGWPADLRKSSVDTLRKLLEGEAADPIGPTRGG